MEHFYPTLALVNMIVHQKTGRVEQDFDKNTLEKLSAVKLELMEERPMSDAVAEALTNGE